uniref:Uncharacterized protein n=1 Tax=viral metagenome TaxID=1070528 RepID=A0A6M3KFX7_9ZZZZ
MEKERFKFIEIRLSAFNPVKIQDIATAYKILIENRITLDELREYVQELQDQFYFDKMIKARQSKPCPECGGTMILQIMENEKHFTCRKCRFGIYGG